MTTDDEPTATAERPDPAGMEFEQARDALEDVVKRLQAGTDSLQQSLDLWEWGEKLAARCEEFLAAATARVADAVGSDADASGPTRG